MRASIPDDTVVRQVWVTSGDLVTRDAQGIGLPVEAEAGHPECEAQKDSNDDGGSVGKPQVVQDEIRGSCEEGRNGIESAVFKDPWCRPGEDIAKGPATDRGGDAKHDGGEPKYAEALRAGSAGYSEQCDSKGVDEGKQPFQAAEETRTQEECHKARNKGGVEIAKVCEGEGRAFIEEDVPGDTATERGDESQGQRPHDVIFVALVITGVESSANGADRDASVIERSNEGMEVDVRAEHVWAFRRRICGAPG
jgi:hypothetical protein